ncbi:MAG: DUF1980 domain-containing protein [Chthoniobacteraceae bacterium]
MQQIFARWLPAATLATWSGVLLYFHFAQRMNDMLAPEFRVYALIAAVVLALMAVAFVVFKGDATCCSSGECGHGLSRLASGKLLTFLILLVPIVAAARYSPREGFSRAFVENRGTATSIEQLGSSAPRPADGKLDIRKPVDVSLPTKDGSKPPAPQPAVAEKSPTDYLVRTPEGNIVTEVLDLLYAAQDNVLRKDFEGKRVELVGQIMPDSSNNAGGHRFKAVRMFMTCCAADARPVATLVEADKIPDFPEMTWVKIIGTPTFPVEKGRRISVLKAEKVEKTEAPPESMIY